MNYYLLPERAKIKGKLIETQDDALEQFIGRSCVFNNPQLKDPLYIIIGDENIFLGNIKTITQSIEDDEELCYVETNVSCYKFKVLTKSPNRISNNRETIEHLNKLLHEACDDVVEKFVADIFVNEEENKK